MGLKHNYGGQSLNKLGSSKFFSFPATLGLVFYHTVSRLKIALIRQFIVERLFILIFRVLKLIDFSFSPLRRFLLQLDSYEIGEGKTLKLNVSEPKTRLFIGNIPKSKGRDEIEEEFKKLSGKVSCVSRRVYLFSKSNSKSKFLFGQIVSCFVDLSSKVVC